MHTHIHICLLCTASCMCVRDFFSSSSSRNVCVIVFLSFAHGIERISFYTLTVVLSLSYPEIGKNLEVIRGFGKENAHSCKS